MTITKYPLPDGTDLVIERLPVTSCTLDGWGIEPPEEWRREGWIDCCPTSGSALLSSGLATDVRVYRRGSSDVTVPYEVFLVERVEDPARRTELSAQATQAQENRARRRNMTYTNPALVNDYSMWERYVMGQVIDYTHPFRPWAL